MTHTPRVEDDDGRTALVFTGIVEEIGELVEVDDLGDSSRLRVRAPRVLDDAAPGDSIAVDGVCLTVTDPDRGAGTFGVDVMGETLKRSGLAQAVAGSRVNLERAATPTTRLGGHIVQGHVDGVATVTGREDGEHWTTVTFGVPGGLTRYVVEKGSITVDGVSLTVTAVDAGTDPTGWFSVGLIPTTLRDTTLGARGVGDAVNLEVDVMAKYVERLTTTHAAPGGPTPNDPGPDDTPAGGRQA